MSLIYEPRGRAREYAPLALNIYKGCGHGCAYCFAPGATHKTREEFGRPVERSDTFLADLNIEATKREVAGLGGGNVLLCFTCDPYQPLDDELRLTRATIDILHRRGYTVTVLTKGGTRALRDIDLFGPGDAFATTLTFTDAKKSLEWEPGAALPYQRIQAINEFHAAGIFTWVSLEPVIDPIASLDLIGMSHRCTDAYKVGTWNHDQRANAIDWREFAHDVSVLLNLAGYERQFDPDTLGKGQYYIKADLARWLE